MNFEVMKEYILESLAKENISEYEIYYSSESSTSVDTLNREINSFSSSSTAGVCLRVCYEGKIGYASTELFTEEQMRSLASRAKMNAAATEKPDTVGIYSGKEDYLPLPKSEYTPLSTAKLRCVALDISDSLYRGSEKIKDGTSSSALCTNVTNYLYNSHGVALSSSSGVNFILAEAVVTDGENSESAYESAVYNSADDVDLISRRATEAAQARLGASLVETGEYSVVFDGKRMRSLLSAFSSAFSAKSAQMGMSRLKGKVGERIASDIVTITDDPMREGAVMKVNFDAEGVPTRRKAVVEGGVLKTLLHNRETSLKDGVTTTANASKARYSSPVAIRPYAFVIEPADMSEEEIIKLAYDGILVTELKGIHAGANAITGDFSLESSGIRIREGKLCEPVRSFTVSGNFFDLLKSIEALSDTVDLGVSTSPTTFGAPMTLVRGLKVSGK